jgi:hypothetical protein
VTEHTLTRFLNPDVQADLPRLLAGLLGDLRQILDCPGLPDCARITAVFAAVDERAPAPGPGDHRFAGKSPQPGSDAERLCEVITGVRRVLIAPDLSHCARLREIRDLLSADPVLT